MAKPISRRLDKLEAERASDARSRVAVIVLPAGELEATAVARHYAAHPEDQAAGLEVLLRRFASPAGQAPA